MKMYNDNYKEETKVKGLKVLMSESYIIIEDAYKIKNKEKMEEIIKNILDKEKCAFRAKRKIASYIKQWRCHNRLQKIFRKKYKKLIIKSNTSNFKNFIYSILGR